jgi:hypothetical protein
VHSQGEVNPLDGFRDHWSPPYVVAVCTVEVYRTSSLTFINYVKYTCHESDFTLDMPIAAEVVYSIMAKSLPQPVELYSRLSDAGIFCSVATGFQYTYPIVLLFFFIAASSITASNSSASQRLRAINTTHDDVTPIQKHFFKGLSLVTALTFVGNSAIAIAQALVDKQEHDWAGKEVVVCRQHHL